MTRRILGALAKAILVRDGPLQARKRYESSGRSRGCSKMVGSLEPVARCLSADDFRSKKRMASGQSERSLAGRGLQFFDFNLLHPGRHGVEFIGDFLPIIPLAKLDRRDGLSIGQ